MKIDKGFKFRGLHSFHDIGLVMPTDPQIRFASKIKNKVRIPGTNKIYTRNNTAHTEELTEVVITCAINVIDFENITIERTHELASRLLEWTMSSSEREKLELDIIPGWYYMAEVETVGDFDTGFFEYGILEVEFTGYPYKIRETSSANEMWDDLCFPTDYLQDVAFKLPRMEDQVAFLELKVGDIVHIGGWAQFVGGNLVDTAPYLYRKAFEVTGKRNRAGGANPEGLIFGAREYELNKEFWVVEQDIIEARSSPVDVVLYNSSSHPIFPEIKFEGSTSLPGITLVRDDKYYDYSPYAPRTSPSASFVRHEPVNDNFKLDPGENRFKIYGQYSTVKFVWHPEVF